MDVLLALVAVLSALAAAISAGIAYRANRDSAKRERESRIREVSLSANRVVATTIRVDELGNQLKLAYQTFFTFVGQGIGGSGLKLFVEGIETKQRSIGPMQNAAREVLSTGVTKISDEKITDWLLEFDGNLAHLERVRETFAADLASVETRNQMYRQDNLNIVGPGA